MVYRKLEIPVSLGNGLNRGEKYLGTIDWYLPYEGKGSVIVQIPKEDGSSIFRTFKVLHNHIQSAPHWDGAKALLETGDVIRFVAGYDNWGVVAHEVRYIGRSTSPDVKRQLEAQRWDLKFANLALGTATEYIAEPERKLVRSIPEILRERRAGEKPLRLIGRPKNE